MSGRTLILNNENAKLYKFNVKWNELFMPITNCNYAEHVTNFLNVDLAYVVRE